MSNFLYIENVVVTLFKIMLFKSTFFASDHLSNAAGKVCSVSFLPYPSSALLAFVSEPQQIYPAVRRM